MYNQNMAIIEFAGIPRSGKTTTAQEIEKQIPGVIVYPERFDLVPNSLKEKPFEYNLWYAKFCIDRLKGARNRPGIHLFERGAVDRIAYGWANFYHGRFSSQQLKDYLALLEPFGQSHNQVFLFNVPPETSYERAVKSGKHITRDFRFLENLHRAYSEVPRKYPRVQEIPQKANISEVSEFVNRMIVESLLPG